MRYILSIDQGTTSSRAIIFDEKGQNLGQHQLEFEQHFPQDGWVEHNPEDIWQTVCDTVQGAIAKAGIQAGDLTALGITNQRETTVIWDRKTGKAIYPAIVWQDRRTADFCKSLKAQGLEAKVQEKTGLLLDPYFSGTKIRWILDNVPGARAQAEKGELAFGTIDSYLVWRLTGGKTHKTDATNACRTLLFNLKDQGWDSELLDIFQVPEALLPEVVDNCGDIGVAAAEHFGAEIPITGMAGDQHAALIGQVCFEPGMGKSTYGTGCFFILNTGEQLVQSQNRLLTTMSYRINGKPHYAIEGSIFIAGAAIQWVRDKLGLIKDAADTQAIAARSEREQSVYVVPAFTGLGAPYWDPEARGGIFGLTRDTDADDIVTAALQSVCYQTVDLIEAMRKDGANLANTLRVDGGMVANDWFVQFLADILDLKIDRPTVTETTALGAAYLAGLGAGVYADLSDVVGQWGCDKSFEPAMATETRQRLYDGWLKAVGRISSEA